MGCCNKKNKKINNQRVEFFDKENQETKLNNILKKIDTEIQNIKEGNIFIFVSASKSVLAVKEAFAFISTNQGLKVSSINIS